MDSMIACHHCGRANDEDHRFCGTCGEKLLGPERSGATITAPEGERPAWVADPVIGVRIRNTLREFELKQWEKQTSIGRASTCDIVLDSPAISAVHCVIERQRGGACVVHDRGSKNGLLTEGGHRRIFELTPGTLFMVAADTPLVAFSAGMQQVRASLQRYLGAVDERHQRRVEDALEATGRRYHVMIETPRGGQAERLARIIHEAGPGGRQPFRVVERIPEALGDQEEMFKSAENGTLAIRVDTLPSNREHLAAYLRKPPYNVRVIAFGAAPARRVGAHLIDAETRRAASIHIPPLAERPRADLMQLISALIVEIGQRVDCTELYTTMDALLDYDWPENLAELEETIEHMLVLRRENGSQRKAAKALGISRGRWRTWYQRWHSRMRVGA